MSSVQVHAYITGVCMCLCVSHRAGCCCIGSCRGSPAAEPSPEAECAQRLSGPDEQNDKHCFFFCLAVFPRKRAFSTILVETDLVLVGQQVVGVRLQFDVVGLKVLDLDGAERHTKKRSE